MSPPLLSSSPPPSPPFPLSLSLSLSLDLWSDLSSLSFSFSSSSLLLSGIWGNRGILNRLSFPERRRLKSFASYAKVGGSSDQTKKAPAVARMGASVAMAAVQVDILALIITVLAPLAIVVLVLGKRGAATLAMALVAVILGLVVQLRSGSATEASAPLVESLVE